MPTDSSVRGISPSYVPDEFTFRRRLEGSETGGFGDDPTQVGLIYTRGWDHTDSAYPLIVYAAQPVETDLAATENRPGVPVDLGIPGVQAVYHDGLWAFGPGEAQVNLEGGVTIHWERSGAHSITIYSPDGTYAVRAPKDTVAFDELARVAKSLNIAG